MRLAALTLIAPLLGGIAFAQSGVTSEKPPSIFRTPVREKGFAGVEGEPIPLDTQEPKYQDYFSKIREKIKANWIYPYEAGSRGIEGNVNIEFVIAKDGHLQHIELRRSSHVAILDAAALNAVKLAHFPPVPDALAKQALAINGLFVYRTGKGSGNTSSGTTSFSSGEGIPQAR
jgi:TonB family protein